MKNTKVSKVMLSTLVTGGIVFSSLFAVSAYNEVEAPNLTKGETQIELPSSELEEVFYNELTFESPITIVEEIKEEGERLQAEREEKLRIEIEKARQAEEARLAKIEAERLAKIEAERKERERIARVEAERIAKIEAKRQAEIKAQKQQKQAQSVKKVQSTNGTAFNGSYYTASCTGCSGITATGYDVRSSIYVDGMRVIAVDPRVIPLYSIVEVSTPHETFKAIALDKGGAIKGNKVDILVANKKTAYSLGRHTVYIKVLRSGR